MYAVIISGGKQHRVFKDQIVKVQKLNLDQGAALDFDQVLMIGAADRSAVQVGAPYVKGACVKAVVVAHGRDDKIRIIKLKRRKHHMKRMGHRQDYTTIQITDIQAA